MTAKSFFPLTFSRRWLVLMLLCGAGLAMITAMLFLDGRPAGKTFVSEGRGDAVDLLAMEKMSGPYALTRRLQVDAGAGRELQVLAEKVSFYQSVKASIENMESMMTEKTAGVDSSLSAIGRALSFKANPHAEANLSEFNRLWPEFAVEVERYSRQKSAPLSIAINQKSEILKNLSLSLERSASRTLVDVSQVRQLSQGLDEIMSVFDQLRQLHIQQEVALSALENERTRLIELAVNRPFQTDSVSSRTDSGGHFLVWAILGALLAVMMAVSLSGYMVSAQREEEWQGAGAKERSPSAANDSSPQPDHLDKMAA